MQGGNSGRSRRHRRKQRLSYSFPSPWEVNSLFQTIRSRLEYLVHFLSAVQVNYNAQVSEPLENMKVINKISRLGIPVRQQTN
ncbi:hypothetical protein [Candidatus Enterovibrio escicola]|uniref:hypothetical protein n=1 Tax=Candidatus Enterovibrio escicola TaxID=1927127 RepID=UPI001680BEDB|nr:hypothetical protein [Candidatus Enterovibrio escacola]